MRDPTTSIPDLEQVLHHKDLPHNGWLLLLSLYTPSFNFNQVLQPRIHRPLLAPATPSYAAYGPKRRQRRARFLLLAACGTLVLVGSSYLYPGPSAGLPIPDRLAPYYTHPMFPGAHSGNAPPPAHGSGHEEHPHPGASPGGRPPPIEGPDSAPSSHSSSNCATDTDSPDVAASAHLPALLSWQPATLPTARARYTLKTSRPPPKGFDAFFAYAKERRCLVVWRDFAPFWRVENPVAEQREK
ncbi:hypothetical protein B0H13DRAFT_2505550 [Mycena leptocephala]|nr:hypothetical protein B0H13DRAFT_2505550 [Mycena leptocephala]